MSLTENANRVRQAPPHVVILGAGASRAALPDGERNGMRLPLMKDLVETVELTGILKSHGYNYQGENFEVLYSNFSLSEKNRPLLEEIEAAVREYFRGMDLPDHATLYDFLVLSLRKKDLIATFNWDPFLLRAVQRNREFEDQMPAIRFLHGNVANGFCYADNRLGADGFSCPDCGEPYSESKLMYPVTKDYAQDQAVRTEWADFKKALGRASLLTIFGYGAPASDAEARRLLKEAWGEALPNKLRWFEIVDVRDEREVLDTWKDFFYSHHRRVYRTLEESWLARYARRTAEVYYDMRVAVSAIVEELSFPDLGTLDALRDTFRPFIEAERAAGGLDSAGRTPTGG